MGSSASSLSSRGGAPNPSFLYALSRSLRRGNQKAGWPCCAPLPIEIVILIFDYAGFMIPLRDAQENLVAHRNIPHSVRSWGPLEEKFLMMSVPFDRGLLAKIKGMQVKTLSNDQGWVSDTNAGEWSWFEVVIFSPRLPQAGKVTQKYITEPEWMGHYYPKRDPLDNKVFKWVSHKNAMASRSASWREGQVFGPDHSLWSSLEEGDRIGVLAYAQFGGWSNTIEDGTWLWWERFDPTKFG